MYGLSQPERGLRPGNVGAQTEAKVRPPRECRHCCLADTRHTFAGLQRIRNAFWSSNDDWKSWRGSWPSNERLRLSTPLRRRSLNSTKLNLSPTFRTLSTRQNLVYPTLVLALSIGASQHRNWLPPSLSISAMVSQSHITSVSTSSDLCTTLLAFVQSCCFQLPTYEFFKSRVADLRSEGTALQDSPAGRVAIAAFRAVGARTSTHSVRTLS